VVDARPALRLLLERITAISWSLTDSSDLREVKSTQPAVVGSSRRGDDPVPSAVVMMAALVTNEAIRHMRVGLPSTNGPILSGHC
jgi:hypothetical protein